MSDVPEDERDLLYLPLMPVLELLASSWSEADFQYEGLTPREREIISEEDFDAIILIMERHGVIERETPRAQA